MEIRLVAQLQIEEGNDGLEYYYDIAIINYQQNLTETPLFVVIIDECKEERHGWQDWRRWCWLFACDKLESIEILRM